MSLTFALEEDKITEQSHALNGEIWVLSGHSEPQGCEHDSLIMCVNTCVDFENVLLSTSTWAFFTWDFKRNPDIKYVSLRYLDKYFHIFLI